jgi:O-antigen ligase
MLGALCLVSGIFFVWDTVCRWADRHEPWTKRILWVNFAFIGMTLWLMKLAHSATSDVCLALGCLVIGAAHTQTGKDHLGLLKVLGPASFALFLILSLGFNMTGNLAQAIGKDPNLSDRTHMWALLLSMQTHPLIGFGYRSFFLGSRISTFWRGMGGDNVLETHNGYLGIYLDLGLIGLFLLCAFLIASYRMICKRLEPFTPLGSLSLTLWIMLLFYNVSEASFENGLLWLTFLIGALVLPERVEDRVTSVTALDERPLEEPVDSAFQVARQPW